MILYQTLKLVCVYLWKHFRTARDGGPALAGLKSYIAGTVCVCKVILLRQYNKANAEITLHIFLFLEWSQRTHSTERLLSPLCCEPKARHAVLGSNSVFSL